MLFACACNKEKAVEAPVVDLAIAGWDGGARPLLVEPGQPSAVDDRAPPRELQRMTGRWEGIGRQDDGQSWELVVEIMATHGGVCATADYPSVPCRAEWFCDGGIDGVVRAREHLLDDSALRCIDNGTMTMRVGSDGLLDWSWNGQGQSARAKLQRVW